MTLLVLVIIFIIAIQKSGSQVKAIKCHKISLPTSVGT